MPQPDDQRIRAQTYLQGLGHVMVDQDNRATQYPLFVVMSEIEQYVEPSAEYDERRRNEEIEDIDLCGPCEVLHDNDEDLPEDCDRCSEYGFVHWKNVEQIDDKAGSFFTADACEMHIQQNNYHYKNPRSYCISAWRNYEMQAVMQFLILNAGHELPSHYR